MGLVPMSASVSKTHGDDSHSPLPTFPGTIHGKVDSNRGWTMKRIIGLLVMTIAAIFVLVGCGGGGGGGGIGTPANAQAPTLFNAGVSKQIVYTVGGTPLSVGTTSSEITFDGVFIAFTDNTGSFGTTSGQNRQVMIPYTAILRITENP